jgi:hypothetical protein
MAIPSQRWLFATGGTARTLGINRCEGHIALETADFSEFPDVVAFAHQLLQVLKTCCYHASHPRQAGSWN